MPSLTKAQLAEIDAQGNPGTPVDVQFNPQSLKLELANKVEGGDTKGRQNRQYLGKTSTTLAFDLHFDTADQGTADEPVSVRTQTALIERFVLPKGSGNDKQAPPRCRFSWGELVLDGVIESVSIDFDLFAADGTPLRAKIGVSIKEQDAKYELLQSGPGANTARGATPPGQPGTGPGSGSLNGGSGPTDSSAQALDGESAADFAARMGLDPSAWRGIAAQLGGASSLSLSAGLSIDFNASLSAGVGIGISAGIEAGVDVSLDASFGLDASVSVGASVSADAAAGFALSAAGGVTSALASVAIAKSDTAAAEARRSFGGTGSTFPSTTPAPSSSPAPSLPSQTRTPLQTGGALPSPSQQAAAPSAPPPPLADPRATTFGQGVPLRPRAAGGAADLRSGETSGRVALRPQGSVSDLVDPAATNDPSAPPWTRLPSGRGRTAADQAQAKRFPAHPCGCGCK